ncbi:MAG TPA: histidine kinase [Hymenobacter sp.]|uniref:sensor histidine kinase n=1 Tax=Hymenobacter sp. TaxID=1898978 RepID=UPI002ED7B2ED
MVQAWAQFWLAPSLAGKPVVGAFPWGSVVDRLSLNFFILLIVAGSAAAIKVLNGWYGQQQQRSQQLRQQQLHTELQLLRAQLQPSFLLQSLGTLRALTARQSPDSPAAVLHLAALLRYLLYDGAQELGPLAEEVDMLRHYVALEKLRFGPQLDVSLNFSGAVEAHAIAPLLLLPFLENAFRHGPDALLECPWLSVDLVATPNSVIFKVINGQPESTGAEDEGQGLYAVRQRLARLYPGQHDLKIVREPDAEIVTLQLQLAAQPHAVPDFSRAPAASPLRSRV